MLLFFTISGFINGISSLIFGFITWINNPKRKVNQLLGLMCLAVAFWAISYGIWLLQDKDNYRGGLLWARMLNFGALFIPISLSWWVLTLLGIENKKKNKIILISGLLFTLFLACFAFPFSPFTHYYVRSVESELFFPFWPKPGILYHFYIVFCYGGLVGYALYFLFKYYRRTTGYKKVQLKYVILGAILGFGGGATNYFLWYDIPIAPWGNPLVVTFPILFSYGVIRYQFMDIRWVLGRSGIYSLSFLIILLYIFAFLFLNQKLGGIVPSNISSAFLGITSIILFFYLFHLFERLAAKYFYYTYYNLKLTLQRLGKQLNQTIELDKLTTLINRSLLDTLKLDKVGIILRDPETGIFKPQQLIKLKEEEITSLLSLKDNFLQKYLQKEKKALVREEIPFLIEEKEKRKE
ncbi:hypothetical protein J7K44_02770, partial [bacterium]|nr:hypothetical protein [bacterium]